MSLIVMFTPSGWGTIIDPERAIHYLSLAASNSASIEEQALASGINKGGAAKGELTLAIYELANCLRHGWGVRKDAVAARQYYETAANLGDTDAMDQAAACYLEGFGGPKDKVRYFSEPTWERRGPKLRSLAMFGTVMQLIIGACTLSQLSIALEFGHSCIDQFTNRIMMKLVQSGAVPSTCGG